MFGIVMRRVVQVRFSVCPRIALFVALMVLLCFTSADVRTHAAHPFHISTAEMEFNAERGVIEVGLRVHSIDMERALSNMTGRRVTIESQAFDEHVVGYLKNRFLFSHNPAELEKRASVADKTAASGSLDGKATKLVGKELEGSWLWVFFEMKAPPFGKAKDGHANAEWGLLNRVLIDLNDGQINTVTVRFGGKRKAMKMDAKNQWRPVEARWFDVQDKSEPGLR